MVSDVFSFTSLSSLFTRSGSTLAFLVFIEVFGGIKFFSNFNPYNYSMSKCEKFVHTDQIAWLISLICTGAKLVCLPSIKWRFGGQLIWLFQSFNESEMNLKNDVQARKCL